MYNVTRIQQCWSSGERSSLAPPPYNVTLCLFVSRNSTGGVGVDSNVTVCLCVSQNSTGGVGTVCLLFVCVCPKTRPGGRCGQRSCHNGNVGICVLTPDGTTLQIYDPQWGRCTNVCIFERKLLLCGHGYEGEQAASSSRASPASSILEGELVEVLCGL